MMISSVILLAHHFGIQIMIVENIIRGGEMLQLMIKRI